ncbi:L,D-transpeptidase [Microbacterium sp.]|uniref:L,D-transpeptidase n=1 Tax=Microbacterium sp. TaxID=51671 RepID=UPI0028126260|nr:L,D-transpeptidase [Microbacterium sp.]
MTTKTAALLVAMVLAVTALTACSSPAPAPTESRAPAQSPPKPPSGTPQPVEVSVAQVATAVVAETVALDAPDGAEVSRFANPTASGAPLVFLVEEAQGDWLRVKLPMRPNGTVGWVRKSDVTIAAVDYSLEVSTTDRSVTLLQDNVPVKTFSAAVGTGDTPTPLGSFYLTELLAPTNQGYGPYAYGISAFSDVLNSFGGGPGQIGMHGTDDSSSIGQAASHGCIRLNNDDITYLAGILPLGTPIVIS